MEAANTVIAVTAFFEAWTEAKLPRKLLMTEVVAPQSDGYVRALLDAGVPVPAPHRPMEHVVEQLDVWYRSLAEWHLAAVPGASAEMRERLAARAVDRYQILYRRLAVEFRSSIKPYLAEL